MNGMSAKEFNEKLPVGSAVIYEDDFGEKHNTFTRTPAWTLGHGEVVVSLEGRSGGYSLERIGTRPSRHNQDLRDLRDIIQNLDRETFGPTAIQRYLKLGYESACRLIDVGIEKGLIIQDDHIGKCRFSGNRI